MEMNQRVLILENHLMQDHEGGQLINPNLNRLSNTMQVIGSYIFCHAVCNGTVKEMMGQKYNVSSFIPRILIFLNHGLNEQEK